MAGGGAVGQRLNTSQASLHAVAKVPNALLRRTHWLAGLNTRLRRCDGHFELTQPCRSSRRRNSRETVATAAIAAVAQRTLYPTSKGYKRGTLRVSHLHTIAYEVHGNPKGQPVLCVHGGPGAGAYANHARFFDPKHWRIVLVDQRGCGASTPRGCLQDNTTQALVADFEQLRRHLDIDTWVLFGGSWGTALSLAYAQAHTDRVDGLILRAICLMSPSEIAWMYNGGVAALQPKAWDNFLAPLPEMEREDPLAAYYARLTSPDTAVRNAAAGAWLQFDMAAGKVPSAQLQSWSGVAWSQADTGAGPAHKLPPLKRAAGSPEANGSGGADASSGVNGSGGAIGSEAINGAANGGAAAEADGKAASPPWAPQPGFGAGASSASAAKPGGASAAGKPGTPQAAPTSSASSGGKSGAAAAGGGSGAPSSAPLPGGDTGMSGFTAQAMLEAHYCVNGAFLLEQTILQNVERLRGIPAIGIQGRLDLVCPAVTAYKLHKAWPELRLRLVGGAGHSQYDPAITHELVEATDAMRNTRWVPPSPQLQVAVY